LLNRAMAREFWLVPYSFSEMTKKLSPGSTT
jgi:hypothetical protein